MARDTLALLQRLRDRAVHDASAALSAAGAELMRHERSLQAHRAEIAGEHATATAADTLAFAAWLPHARTQEAALLAATAEAQARADRCRQVLVARRTDAEIVVKLQERRMAEASLVAGRRDQALMDEMASRPRGDRPAG